MDEEDIEAYYESQIEMLATKIAQQDQMIGMLTRTVDHLSDSHASLMELYYLKVHNVDPSTMPQPVSTIVRKPSKAPDSL